MKKIILLMLLAFSSTDLVHATLLDDKIIEHRNIITQMSDNILGNAPNHNLHLMLKQQLDVIWNEITLLSREESITLQNIADTLGKMNNQSNWMNTRHKNTIDALHNTLINFYAANNTLHEMKAMQIHTDTLGTWARDFITK
ncbi:MAG: hypothetical protein Q8L85_06900 [Alphaproteobacteria bacterium]|nr:hypothetical protein [Alphaproteobacteria bacterium]